ncbi:MAG: hypothetical protein FGF52_01040 [Candidatus Brockarchaeota archaeon]|nr:hypothetical protein [Candidatus Brockarchaeota archaeon]
MQKGEAVYSIGNLLVFIGIAILVSFALFSVVEVSGFLRTGINLLSSILILSGSGIPIILKEMEISQRLRSVGVRCFASSFIVSIIMGVQMLTRGWASTVPVLASVLLASIGIVAYVFSAKGGKLTQPSFREILFLLSAVVIFAIPMIQLSLPRLGISVEASRTISVSLLIAFAIVLYLSIKAPPREKG